MTVLIGSGQLRFVSPKSKFRSVMLWPISLTQIETHMWPCMQCHGCLM